MNNQKLIEDFSIEELESRLEMKAWVEVVPCDDPSHCHNPEELQNQ
ncbi:hypothetical protein SAMN06265349_10625 [Flavobacterium resistens]|uniref:Uncharacterized protein n=1 Tax=Flavobacterium resistens TaxID=443612 RepID=A0A521EZC1_9FLAO|nr:hypothetical protein [Flavobacterium resistens]MRX69332.1 hypothetical protein [Flavobacterium resistens]SMO89298.1 hypothetical protein SAMN06265349_10625 [Flavobacterium resistens]